MRALFLLSFILIVTAPVVQVMWSIKRIRRKSKISIALIADLMLLLGMALSALATTVALYALPKGIKCAPGAYGFVTLGFLISIATAPIVAIVGHLVYNRTKQKTGTL